MPDLSVQALEALLISLVAESLGVAPEAIAPATPLRRYGLDSLAAVTITADLEDRLGCPIDPALILDHPTVESIARFLARPERDPAEP